MNNNKLNLSIIFPIFNEEQRLPRTLSLLQNFSEKYTKKEIELIFVNDGSDDNSKNLLNNFIKKNKKINSKIVNYKKNMGKGYAIKRGVLRSKNYWIAICDCDLSVHPNQIITWFKENKITSSNCAYYGSREHQQSKINANALRVFFGYFFKKIIKFFFKINLSDTQCGLKVFNKKYSKKVFKKLSIDGFAFDVQLTVLLMKKKIKIVELPLKWTHMPGSKLNLFLDIPKMLIEIIKIKIIT